MPSRVKVSKSGKAAKGSKNLSLVEIADGNLFPWTRDIRKVRDAVKRDFWGDNLLEAKIHGEGRRQRYSIPSENIKKFVERYGPGYKMSRPRRI